MHTLGSVIPHEMKNEELVLTCIAEANPEVLNEALFTLGIICFFPECEFFMGERQHHIRGSKQS